MPWSGETLCERNAGKKSALLSAQVLGPGARLCACAESVPLRSARFIGCGRRLKQGNCVCALLPRGPVWWVLVSSLRCIRGSSSSHPGPPCVLELGMFPELNNLLNTTPEGVEQVRGHKVEEEVGFWERGGRPHTRMKRTRTSGKSRDVPGPGVLGSCSPQRAGPRGCAEHLGLRKVGILSVSEGLVCP